MEEVFFALGLAVLGFWNGYFLGKRTNKQKATPPTPEDRELLRIREERAAFQDLMHYNVETAYGKED